MSPQVLDRYQSALSMDQPVTALRRAAQLRLVEGATAPDVENELEELRAELERTHRPQEEEAVAEVMDMLEGWCPPYLDLSGDQRPGRFA